MSTNPLISIITVVKDGAAPLEQAIKRELHFIARHPSTLFQCLWNLMGMNGFTLVGVNLPANKNKMIEHQT